MKIVLEPGRAEARYWRDLWLYRELFAILAWRDVSVRYKQTVIGIAWAFLRPFLTMVIFTVVFGRLARLPSDGATPYPVMVFAGLLPWFLMSTILSETANSLVANSNLIGKVYFPRIIIPSATAVVALVDFCINLAVFAALMAWYGFPPSWRLLLLPLCAAMAVLASLGPSLLVSALNVRYRDVRHIIPFVIQVGLYVSPVGFSSVVVPQQWRFWYALNPAVGVIEAFRWCLLGGNTPFHPGDCLSSLVISSVMLWIGLGYFRRTENSFADTI